MSGWRRWDNLDPHKMDKAILILIILINVIIKLILTIMLTILIRQLFHVIVIMT